MHTSTTSAANSITMSCFCSEKESRGALCLKEAVAYHTAWSLPASWLKAAWASAGTSLQTAVPEINVAKSLECSPFHPCGFLAHS